MVLDPQWFYTILTIPFVAVWLVLFGISSRWRRAQVGVSAIFAIVGIAVENLFYFQDYWRPPPLVHASLGPVVIYPEFLLFGAAFAGIALVLYPTLFGFVRSGLSVTNTHLRATAGTAIFITTSYTLWFAGLNSIFTTAVGALAITLLVAWRRPDLRVPAVVSGVSTAVVMFILYSIGVATIANLEEILSSIWYLHNTALDVRLYSVPITELVWGFSVGSAIGVFYMYVRGAHYSRI